MSEKIIGFFIIVFYIAGGIGWALNFFMFFCLNFESPYRAEVIRGIGVVSPLGAVMGYINIKD